jgi:Ca2+-binding RTX toxin-like protein
MSLALYLRAMMPAAAAAGPGDPVDAAPLPQDHDAAQMTPEVALSGRDAARPAPQAADPVPADNGPADPAGDLKVGAGNVVSLFAARDRRAPASGGAPAANGHGLTGDDSFAQHLWDDSRDLPAADLADLPAPVRAGSLPVGQGRQDANHAPVRLRSVELTNVINSAAVLITIASLLDHVSDADADTLAVKDLRASSGTLTPTEGGFIYLPDPNFVGQVQLSYHVSDGTAEVAQTAEFGVDPNPVAGTAGDDVLAGGGGIDAIAGDAGNDVIDGRQGNDTITGGDGDDRIYGGVGDDALFGGNGADMLFGGAGRDRISGGNGADKIFGGDGGDVLFGDAGDDLIDGGAADDLLVGGEGNDWLTDGSGADTVYGGAGADTFRAAADADSDHSEGGEGRDTLDLSAFSEGLTIDLRHGTVTGASGVTDTVTGFEIVIGSAGDDLFLIGAEQTELTGGGGGDRYVFGHFDDIHEYAAAIQSFAVGDKIDTRRFNFFDDQGDAPSAGLMLGNAGSVEGLDMASITFFFGAEDGAEFTRLEVREDDAYAYAITVYGHHQFTMNVAH